MSEDDNGSGQEGWSARQGRADTLPLATVDVVLKHIFDTQDLTVILVPILVDGKSSYNIRVPGLSREQFEQKLPLAKEQWDGDRGTFIVEKEPLEALFRARYKKDILPNGTPSR